MGAACRRQHLPRLDRRPASSPGLIHVATMILARPKDLGQGRGTREAQAEFDFKDTYTLHGWMDGQWQGMHL